MHEVLNSGYGGVPSVKNRTSIIIIFFVSDVRRTQHEGLVVVGSERVWADFLVVYFSVADNDGPNNTLDIPIRHFYGYWKHTNTRRHTIRRQVRRKNR